MYQVHHVVAVVLPTGASALEAAIDLLDVEVHLTVCDLDALAGVARDHLPALVLIDLDLPSGIEGARSARKAVGPLPVLMTIASRMTAAWQDALVPLRAIPALFRPLEPVEVAELLRTVLPPIPNPRMPRVLLVDDDETVLKIMRMQLEAAGLRVTAVRDAITALAAAEANAFDVIVCDALMPHLDGFGFTQRIRRIPEVASVPVILVSQSYVDASAHRLAHACGANAYVQRDVDLRSLFDELGKVLTLRPGPTVLPEDVQGQIEQAKDEQIRLLLGLVAQMGRIRSLSQTALTILDNASRLSADGGSPQDIPGRILQLCAESGDLAVAALYLVGPDDRLVLHGAAGAKFVEQRSAPAAIAVERALDRAGRASEELAAFPGSALDLDAVLPLLREIGTGSALVAPLRVGGERIGALALGSNRADISAAEWRTFGRTLATVLALVLALGRSRAGSRASHS